MAEPTFEDYVTARRVILYVRDELARQVKQPSIADDPLFSVIVFRSCWLKDPSLAKTATMNAECLMMKGALADE